MSQQLISLNQDLKRLRDEGYDIHIIDGHLVVGDVPYVNSQRQVKRGTLISELNLAGNETTKPRTHVIYFNGEHPCHNNGEVIAQIQHQTQSRQLAPGITVQHSFSNKPKAGYQDYYEKISTYISIISSPAESLEPTATAKTFPVIEADGEASVFHYEETASSRAGIAYHTAKLMTGKVAIIGLGGTGSYILDLIAKTPVQEIHLFDPDAFSQHNAFRSPGAASISDLQARAKKVNYFADAYSDMRGSIYPHDCFIDESNVHQLEGMSFVFIAVDKGSSKASVIPFLERAGIPYIDVGMGLHQTEDGIGGVLRTTTSTAQARNHVRDRISYSDDGDGRNEYSQNIQIADLNALNAALAVIKWKKHLGFYHDFEHEHNSTYTIDGNAIDNDDQYHP